MMAVQSNRANLLEAQLKDQVSSVQAKNDRISSLNQLLGSLNKAAAAMPADAKAGDKVGISSDTAADISAAAGSAGITLPAELSVPKKWVVQLGDSTFTASEAEKNEFERLKAQGKPFSVLGVQVSIGSITPSTPQPTPQPTKGQLDGFIQEVKSQIDSMSNSQQMDMLRLQSLSNKRNEAFDVMTNFIKKMQDSRSSIIGNMR
ncbi:hypothetical protein [Acidovorax sp.]|uniref:hypothetical protein n=1 Tax=Acidovorax sp. TaxID=1872122 RepID=UPI00260F09F2|nr:hypothetical protein [Acidovorax sp.]